jgi:uncharacterized membrane protein (DUF2068 family)
MNTTRHDAAKDTHLLHGHALGLRVDKLFVVEPVEEGNRRIELAQLALLAGLPVLPDLLEFVEAWGAHLFD